MDNAITARHFFSGAPTRVRWQNGRIAEVSPAQTAPENLWLAPTLCDIQMNGYAGIDFQQDNLTLDGLIHATRELRAAACGEYFFTLITAEWTQLLERLRRAKKIRDENAELTRALSGWHIEGPFLSDQPGYCGAHNPKWMRDPKPENMQALRDIFGDDPLMVTLAPERSGAVATIRAAQALNIRISFGHTNAPAEILKTDFGSIGFTHLGNGCAKELDRHDNLIWRVLDAEMQTGRFTIGLIPDKIHVSPQLFRIFHRVIPREKIYYTTDAVSAAGSAPGRYQVGEHTVEVGADQIVRQPGRTNFAGSALRPIDGVLRASEMLGESWRTTWASFSDTPRRFMSLATSLEPGASANFCLMESAGDKIQSAQIFVDGNAHAVKL